MIVLNLTLSINIMLQDDLLIYLDLEFISRKYEEKFDTDPDLKITMQQGAKADISAFFANAGITTQESRTYSITSRSMLHALWKKLNSDYHLFSNFTNYEGTKIVWMEGVLTIAEWSNSDEPSSRFEFYQLNHPNNQRTAFLSNESYFSAGFANVFKASSALKGNIGIPVKCLARIMWHVDDAKNYVACPYIIIEKT